MTFARTARQLAVMALGAIALAGCSDTTSSLLPPVVPLEQQVWAPSLGINLAGMTKLPSGVYIQDLTVGTGATAASNSTITVFYTLWIANGTQVQTNVGATPFTRALSELIEGWKAGIPGMKVGGKRRLVIPSELGYGISAQPGIPANSNLVFDVTLSSIP